MKGATRGRLAGLLLALCVHLAFLAAFLAQPPARGPALPDPSRMVLAWVLPPAPRVRTMPLPKPPPALARAPKRKPAARSSTTAAVPQPLPAPGAALEAAADDLPGDPFAETAPASLHDPKIIDGAIKKAFAEQKALEDTQKFVKSGPPPTKYERFAADARHAKIPNCLSPDGLKHNPPVIKVGGVPVFGVGGVLALPFLAQAAVTGKCKVN